MNVSNSIGAIVCKELMLYIVASTAIIKIIYINGLTTKFWNSYILLLISKLTLLVLNIL